jgi:hypothetical protein
MKELESACGCGSGMKFMDCCYKDNSVVDLTQYKFDQAEENLRVRLVDFSHHSEIQAQIGEAFYIWKNDRDLLIEDISEEDVDDLTFAKFFDWFIYDFKLLGEGKRIIERFYEEERESLSDIEKNIVKDWINNLHSFFEVEEVFPKESCRIKDIFTGEIFQVKDSASSEQIKPLDIVSARPIKTGNNNYFSGVILVYPPSLKPLIVDFFNREFKEYKKTFGKKQTFKDYLKDWGFLIGNYIEETVNNPRFVTPEGDELVSASSTYNLRHYKKALKILRGIKSLDEIEGGTDELRVFSWIRRGKNKISVTIEIEKDKITIESYSIDLLSKAKNLIERKLAGLVIYQEDKIRQLDSYIDRKHHGPQKSNKTVLGLNSKNELDGVLDEYYDDWIDKPLQRLQGKTPREALNTKKGREKLNSILDELQNIYEHARHRGEPYYNVLKLRKKLRLE